MTETVQPVATWRIVLAAILDFITAFFVFGYLVAMATGGLTETGFSLNGWPALLVLALVVAYFVAGKYMGGRPWQRLLGAVRR